MVPAQFLPASVADSLKACACGSGGNGGNWGAGGGDGRTRPTDATQGLETSELGSACAGRGRRQAWGCGPALRPRPPQVICLTVLASVRIYYQYRRVKPVTREIVIRDPYALRPLRRLIDAYAFRIYGHWVKKGQQQNRAALFENTPKAVLLSLAEEDF